MEQVEDFKIDPVPFLKEFGLRITPQRVAILSNLSKIREHMTAEQIYNKIEGEFPSLSVATVYNTLKAFMDAGFVKELRVGDHASKFDLCLTPHHHLICEKCGCIEDFVFPNLPVAEIAIMNKFQIKNYHLEISGVCEKCQSEQMV